MGRHTDQPAIIRSRFTLGHELGHIVISWHTGNIFDKIDAKQDEDLKFWYIEQEANLFSSEILMPYKYMKEICKEILSFEGLISGIVDQCNVSVPAAIIRIADFLQRNVILYVKSPYDSRVIQRRSRGTSIWFGNFESIAEVIDANIPNGEREYFLINGYEICVLFFPNTLPLPEVDLAAPWRPMLDAVLKRVYSPSDMELLKLKESINGKISYINSNFRDLHDMNELYAEAIHRFSSDGRFSPLLDYLDFHRVIVLRLQEMLARRAN